MINIKISQSNLLKTDKELHGDIDIYYMSYTMVRNFSDYENVCAVNPLYLIIHFARGHFKEKYGEKYLIIDSTEYYEKVFSGIKSKVTTLNSGKELFYEKNYANTGINTDNNLLLNKQLKFSILAIIIRCVLQKDKKLYPQIYLDDCLYEKC